MLAGDMDDIINGLNALSRQPFVIDEFIFEAQKWSYDNALDKDSKLNVPKFPTQWNVGQESVDDWSALGKKQRKALATRNKRKAKRDSVNRARRTVWDDERKWIEAHLKKDKHWVIHDLDTEAEAMARATSTSSAKSGSERYFLHIKECQ